MTCSSSHDGESATTSILASLARFLAPTLLVFVLAAFGPIGCNVVGAAAYVAEGPPKVDAQYTLPYKTVVVFIDDRGSVIPRSRLRRVMADRATHELLKVEEVIPAAIDPEAAVQTARREDPGGLLPIDEIGRRVGAEMVIYVEPRQFDLVVSGYPRPVATFSVKVIDCQSGQRMFPLEGECIALARMATKTESRYQDTAAISALEQDLAEFAGLRIAQVFFKHEENPLDGRVSE